MDRKKQEREVLQVGIVTISRQFILSNFGTFFQHWSLRKVLQSFGYAPFRVADIGESHRTIIWIAMRTLKRLLLVPYRCFRGQLSLRGECKSLCFTLCQNIKFYREYKRVIGNIFDDTKFYECITVIIGSDQIWTSSREREFACVFSDDCDKISYAASADWLRVKCSEQWESRIRAELPKYKGISVRERQGIDVIKELMQKDISIFHAIDPVFLTGREEYLRTFCANNLAEEPVLLYYVVNINSYEELNYAEILQTAKSLNVQLKVVGLQGAERFLPLSAQTIASPSKFLELYHRAKYVVTNSFHGTAFALIFGKRFACIKQVERCGASQNTRCHELLEKLGLMGYWLESKFTSNDLAACLKQEIDFNLINDEILKWKISSLKWLESTLATDRVKDSEDT